MNKTRLEAFSDGVLAIILTIMVLEFKIPHGSGWHELRELIPIFISYALSFANIGIYWGNHHHLLHSVKHVTSGMMLANLNWLFWLSIIPYATGWMGENNLEANPVAFYCIVLLLCSISYLILQKVAEKNSHDIEALNEAFKKSRIKYVISFMVVISAIIFAYIQPYISVTILICSSTMWLIPDRNIEKALNNEI